MGKTTLAVLVLAIALGVYWFWWSDQGANNPIAVEGTFSVTGVQGMPGMQGPMKGNFTIHATPRKIRFTTSGQGEGSSALVRLDQRKAYALNEKKKIYYLEKFDFVDLSQTKTSEKAERTWPGELKRSADWDNIGAADAKRFCNKQRLTGLPGEVKEIIHILETGAPALTQMEAVLKNSPWVLWFTPETRFGRRYFGTLNKLLRIRNIKGAKARRKRPQFKYASLDFFPFPMKAVISLPPIRIEMEVKKLSRKRIPGEVFDIPSDYRQVSKTELAESFKPTAR